MVSRKVKITLAAVLALFCFSWPAWKRKANSSAISTAASPWEDDNVDVGLQDLFDGDSTQDQLATGTWSSSHCIDQWYWQGKVCEGRDPKGSILLDVVWNWFERRNFFDVMGSQTTEGSNPKEDPAPYYLIESLRSAKRFLNNIGNLHLVTPDVSSETWLASKFESVVEKSLDTTWLEFQDSAGEKRFGQAPAWLNSTLILRAAEFDSTSDKLFLHHHWDSICHFPLENAHLQAWHTENLGPLSFNGLLEQTCRKRYTPPLSGDSAEHLLAHQNALTDVFIYIKKNVFWSKFYTTTDYFSPLYGTGIRLGFTSVNYDGTLVKNDEVISPRREKALSNANALLNLKFGFRNRNIVFEAPMAISKTIVEEMERVFRTSLRDVASSGEDDKAIDFVQLYAHYIIERHREALLWIFFVLKMDGDGDGHYSAQERQHILATMGYTGDRQIQVLYPKRTTLKGSTVDDHHRNISHSPMKNTDVQFTSMDGFYQAPWDSNRSPRGWANYTFYGKEDIADVTPVACKLAPMCTDFLFDASKETSPESIFRLFASQLWGCGDCLLVRLVQISGERGLQGILPPRNAHMPKSYNVFTTAQDPILSEAPVSDMADVSLAATCETNNCLGQESVTFASALLNRYAYFLPSNNAFSDFYPFVLADNTSFQAIKSRLRAGPPAAFSLQARAQPDRKPHDLHNDMKNIVEEAFPQTLHFENRK